MPIDYPSDLRSPLGNQKKEQSRTIDESQPLSGPAYTRKLSTDAPVFYDLEFKFNFKNDALVFRAWVEFNKIYEGVEFNCPIRTEASNQNTGEEQLTQLVRLVAGDIRSYSTQINVGFFTYRGRFRARKEITGLEDYYELISEGGAYLLEGREPLDIAINILAPEGD